ncbi:unnamed protein product [Victoria cruziana]
MSTIFHIYNGVFLLCQLLNSFLRRFGPKSCSSWLPLSWFRLPSSREPQMSETPSQMDPAELRRVFQMFDRNGDGRITKRELSDSLENLGIFIPEKDLVAMIDKIDVNGDGCVDIDEFGVLYQTIMDEKDEEEDMREAFNVFDQNGDGFITVEELRSVLSSLGLKQGRTVEDCKKMIRKVDADGDGMVNYKEFKQMMKGGGFAALT